MVKIIGRYTGKVYECDVCHYQWPQRPIVSRIGEGKKIKQLKLADPKVCSDCKAKKF